MVRKLIIRIAKDEAGESNFSNLSSEELNEIRTEIIRVLYAAKFLNIWFELIINGTKLL